MRKYLLYLLLVVITSPAFSQEIKTDTISEVTVTGKYYRKYTTNTVSSALRIKTPLLQLSQNIQTVNADVILDQAIFNTTDGVTRNVSGIVRQDVSNNSGPNIFMRGPDFSTAEWHGFNTAVPWPGAR